jgi:hypothetical protein
LGGYGYVLVGTNADRYAIFLRQSHKKTSQIRESGEEECKEIGGYGGRLVHRFAPTVKP